MIRGTMNLAATALLALIVATSSRPAVAQEPFMGQIQYFPYSFEVKDWKFCNGQLLPIGEYPALFSLMGTAFGGDGRTTFGLPDMRGRIPLHPGRGPGLSWRRWGEIGGSETATLGIAHLPQHLHTLNATTELGTRTSPAGAVPARDRRDQTYADTAPDADMHVDHITSAGGTVRHENMPPWLGLNCQVALDGAYPSRN